MKKLAKWLANQSTGVRGGIVLVLGACLWVVPSGRGGEAIGLAAATSGAVGIALERYDPVKRRPRWVPIFIILMLAGAGVTLGVWVAEAAARLPAIVVATATPVAVLYAITRVQRPEYVDDWKRWWSWTVVGWLTAPTLIAYVLAAAVFGPDKVLHLLVGKIPAPLRELLGLGT